MARKLLGYSTSDFDTLVSELQAKLAATATWRDAYRSGAGQMIIELFAYIGDMLSYKIERRAEESDPRYAQLRSSVEAFATLLNYSIRRKVSSICTAQFSIAAAYWASHTNPIIINKYLSLSSDGGIPFVVSEDTSIPVGTTYADVTIRQGTYTTSSVVSDETAAQTIDIPASDVAVDDVENSSVVVSVDGTEWTKVSSFIGQADSAEVYTLRIVDDRIQVEFGNGVFGKIPTSGEIILVEWLESLGEAGNVFGTGLITTINGTIEDSGGVDVTTDVSVTNTESATAGEDEETVEEIRENMTQVFPTGDRGVSAEDYIALLLAYPGVLKATAYGEQEVLGGALSNPDYAWRVELVVYPTGYESMTTIVYTALKAAIESYLEDKKCITAGIQWADPVVVYIDFDTSAFATAEASLSDVATDIAAVFADLLDIATIELGEDLRYSDVLEGVNEVDGVSYHKTDVYAAKVLTQASALVWGGTLDVTPIVKGKVSVYQQDASGNLTKLASDDLSGTIVAIGNSGASGTVDYDTGDVSVTTFADVSPEEIRVRYQTTDEDLVTLGTGDGAETEFGGTLKKPTSRGLVTVYIDDLYVGVDDGDGNILDAGSGYIDESASTVNYTSGVVNVTFTVGGTPASGTLVQVNYSFDGQDMVVSTNYLLRPGIDDISVERVT